MTSARTPSTHQVPLFCSEISGPKARPFLKWAGGKTRLLPELRRCIPRRFGRYFEPFLGGGALFFDLEPRRAILSDANPELIHCAQVVAKRPEEVIETLKGLSVSEQEFYRTRAVLPDTLRDVPRAARFIYLNKTCYNGLYRVNKSGQFNTPFGHYEGVSLFDSDTIRAASHALRNANLLCSDYSAVLESATRGDFVYFDPPYLPIGKNSDFKRYTKHFFYEADHIALAKSMEKLHERGCSVLLSNSFHPRVAELYEDFFRLTVMAPRFVNCKGGGRGKIKELLIANYPIPVSK